MHVNEISDSPHDSKISAEFGARLDRLDAEQLVQVIVILDMEGTGQVPSQDVSDQAGYSKHDAPGFDAKEAFKEIDALLELSGGKRLMEKPNLLGAILLEVTVASLQKLCELPVVKVILEDQPISMMPAPRSSSS